MGEEDIEIEKRDIEMGIIDMTDRVLGEVIKTPFVKGIIRTVLNEIDPKSASNLMKTLVWKDPEMILDVFGAVPALVNTVVGIVKEVGPAFEHFTPKILGGVVKGIVNDIDVEGLGEVVNSLSQFIVVMHKEQPTVIADAVSEFVQNVVPAIDFGLIREAIEGFSGEVDPIEELFLKSFIYENIFKTVSLAHGLTSLVSMVIKLLEKIVYDFGEFSSEAVSIILLRIVENVDAQGIGKFIDSAIRTLGIMFNDFQDFVPKFISDIVSAIDGERLAKFLKVLLDSVLDGIRNNPDFISSLLPPLSKSISDLGISLITTATEGE